MGRQLSFSLFLARWDKTLGSISERGKAFSRIQMLLRESTCPIFPRAPMAARSFRPLGHPAGSFFLWVRCFQAENKIMARRQARKAPRAEKMARREIAKIVGETAPVRPARATTKGARGRKKIKGPSIHVPFLGGWRGRREIEMEERRGEGRATRTREHTRWKCRASDRVIESPRDKRVRINQTTRRDWLPDRTKLLRDRKLSGRSMARVAIDCYC